uniref:Uncharacterized protein n=1 Tax=Anguilla anguilla TaxID=7936 RepID=A0A0E9P5N8_ANGAN
MQAGIDQHWRTQSISLGTG